MEWASRLRTLLRSPRLHHTSWCGIAAAAAIAACGPAPLSPRSDVAEKPNVVLISLDTTRPDRLTPYAPERDLTPELGRFAADAVLYARAVSSSSWTLPSHASMFTGKYPPSHGARYDPKGPLFLSHGIDDDGEFREYRARGLAQDEVTLAALLQADDYATGAVVAGPWMKRIFGLDAGFDHYDDSLVTQLAGGLAADVTDAALDWVRAHADERQFLFLNYYDPHSPYGPPTAFRFFSGPRLWFTPGTPEAEARFLYDAEVEYLDRHLGRFFEGLRDLALYEDALIIVTADHGELLGEQGHFGHGKLLTEAELHVPLIVKFPSNANAGGRHEARVSNTGLFAMVLEQVGLEAPATAQADLRGETRAPIIAEVNPLAVVADTGASRALYAGRFKLLWNVGTGATLHDLEADPSGTVDFSPSFPDVAREMRRALDDFYANAPKPGEAGPARQVDEETMRALESLGYLEDGAQGGSP